MLGVTRYLGAAQAAVNRLDSGALVSAAFGVCATRAGAGTCTGDASQAWTVQGTGRLKNAETGLCLRDARGNHPAGAPLALAPCAHTRAKTWWLPQG